MAEFTIVPQGEFSLREAALFGFGQRMRPAGVGDRDPAWDGVMRLAFCLDGYTEQVGVEVRQDDTGVHCSYQGSRKAKAVEAQVARMLSLDHDARSYGEVGESDPVIARLQRAAPGLRPPLFHSPYEAAAWSVLSARRSSWQMAKVRTELSTAHGRVFDLSGETCAALPTPDQLLAVDQFAGIEPQRLQRLHGVARAAKDGLLDTARLRERGPEAATEDVQQIKGIGPFYAGLIVVRAVGFADVLPADEPRGREIARQLYERDELTTTQFAELAERWRPWRTWATVLVRAVGPRVLG